MSPGRGKGRRASDAGRGRLDAGVGSVYTDGRGQTTRDWRDANDGDADPVHGRGAAALAGLGAGLGRDRLGLGAGDAGPSCLTRIAVALERIAEAQEHIAASLGRRAEDGREARSPQDGAAVMSVSPAAFVTQKNCLDCLGLPPRRFLELLRRQDAPPVQVVGKLRMVNRDSMLEYLGRLAASPTRRDAGSEPDGADAVLREIGCSRTRGGRNA